MPEYFANLPDESARVPAMDRAIERARDEEIARSRPVRLRYRCRSCGAVYGFDGESKPLPGGETLASLLSMICRNRGPNVAPDVHECSDRIAGLADLAGIEFV
jgi:hypothetical protein